MKRFLASVNSVLMAVLIYSLIVPVSFAATLGYQIDMLLSQVRTATGGSISGGKVYFYEAGTTTAKDVYTDVNKSVVAANPYTLDANGTAMLYGDGLYRIVIKSSAGVTLFDRDNLRYEDFGTTMTRITTLIGDNTGRIWGFDIGASGYTDKGFFEDIVTRGPSVDVRSFMDGQSGRNTLAAWEANNTIDVTDAIQAAIDSVTYGTIYFPTGNYAHTGITIGSSKRLAGPYGAAATLDYTPSSGTGILISDSSTRVIIEGLTIESSGGSSGWGIRSAGFASVVSIRDVYVNDFNSGIYIQEPLLTDIKNVRMTLAGKANAGSIGIMAGTDETTQGNAVKIENAYIAAVETGIVSYAYQTTIISPIFETIVNGIRAQNRTVLIQGWFNTDTYDVIVGSTKGALVAVGLMNQSIGMKISYASDSIKEKCIIIPGELSTSSPIQIGPYYWDQITGFSSTKLRAYASTTQSLTDNTWTKVALNVEEFDVNAEYDNSTYTATIKDPGYYEAKGQVMLSAIEDNTRLGVALYVNGAEKTNVEIQASGATTYPVSFTSDLIYVSTDNTTVELYVRQVKPTPGAQSTNPGKGKVYMSIHRVM